MAISIPIKTKDRLVSGLKKFQPILAKAKEKDINESDTVTIIVDMLADILGYDKYTEITSEFAIKKTFCDIAIKMDGRICLLIEVKAINSTLKDDHLRQAINYGQGEGVEWVILTNGDTWKVYNIKFAKPVEHELVYDFNVLDLSLKRQDDIEKLFYIGRESLSKPTNKTSLDDFRVQKQVLSRYMIGQLLMHENTLDTVRKLLKKISPDIKVTNEEILQIVAEETIKREVLVDEKAAEARKNIAKMEKQKAKEAKARVVSQERGGEEPV